MFITESWLSNTDSVLLNQLKIPNFNIFNCSRESTVGGGGQISEGRNEISLRSSKSIGELGIRTIGTAWLVYSLLYRSPASDTQD